MSREPFVFPRRCAHCGAIRLPEEVVTVDTRYVCRAGIGCAADGESR